MEKRQFRFIKGFFEIDGKYNIPGFSIYTGHGYGFYTYCCKTCGEIFTLDEEKFRDTTIDLNEITKNKTCPTCKSNLVDNLAKYPENIFYKGMVYQNKNIIDSSDFQETEIMETYVL